jgi:hypothetical protein
VPALDSRSPGSPTNLAALAATALNTKDEATPFVVTLLLTA